MSTIDETIKQLKSLEYLPTYTLRKVRHYCPVDNNVDRPEKDRLRGSFKATRHGDHYAVIESNSPYLEYVVHGRGPVYPKGPPTGAKHLRWRAGLHGNGSSFPNKSNGYFFSGYAGPVTGNPFIDKAYWDVMDHISNRSLRDIAHELEVYGSDFDIRLYS